MVKINNQRKAFLDMLAWSEEEVMADQKTRNHGYDVIVGGNILLITPITLANLSHGLKNSNQQAADATSFFPVGGMPTASRLGLKDFSPKSQDAVALQQIGRGALRW